MEQEQDRLDRKLFAMVKQNMAQSNIGEQAGLMAGDELEVSHPRGWAVDSEGMVGRGGNSRNIRVDNGNGVIGVEFAEVEPS